MIAQNDAAVEPSTRLAGSEHPAGHRELWHRRPGSTAKREPVSRPPLFADGDIGRAHKAE